MRDDAAYLLDMLVWARDAVPFVRDLTWDQFRASHLHQSAVIKAIEVVGEAAGRISGETRDRHPEVPWDSIIGMRHRLVHGYHDVNLQRVWDTARIDIPALIDRVAPLVRPDCDGPDSAEGWSIG
jgi:uncharacterized protein with HEPN domain